MTNTMKYESWGTKYILSFVKGKYQNNNSLAIQIMCKEEDALEPNFEEPFARLTVNLAVSPANEECAYIDTNNVPMDLVQKLIAEGVMTPTGVEQMSGWCIYPECRFDHEWLESLRRC